MGVGERGSGELHTKRRLGGAMLAIHRALSRSFTSTGRLESVAMKSEEVSFFKFPGRSFTAAQPVIHSSCIGNFVNLSTTPADRS